MVWFCRGARTANWNYHEMFWFLFHPLSFLCSDAQSRAKLQVRRAPRSLKTWKYFTFSMTSKVESTLWGASRQLPASSCANYVKKSELWHKSYVSSLTFDVKILKIVGNEQNQTRYGPPVCLLYPDTATLPAWCWPNFFEQKTYNFNLDFDILCVKLNLKTYFLVPFSSRIKTLAVLHMLIWGVSQTPKP